MPGFLLDTNCISEVTKPRPSVAVVAWMEGVEERLLYLSVLTLGEIRRGVEGLPAGRRRAQLEAWLEAELPTRFAGRILPVGAGIALRWGQMSARARARGQALPVVDGLLAATALEHNLTIVSRNGADFAAAQVSVVNPWTD